MPLPTPQLQSEYQRLFDSSFVRPEKNAEVDSILKKILQGRSSYEAVEKKLNIPRYFIGIIHCLEGSCNFKAHLHNGDPLTAKTVQVPAILPTRSSG